jgi:hypothetical protein
MRGTLGRLTVAMLGVVLGGCVSSEMMQFAPSDPPLRPLVLGEPVQGEFDAIDPVWMKKYPWTRIRHRYWMEAPAGTLVTVRVRSAGPAVAVSIKDRKTPSAWSGDGTFAADSQPQYEDHNGPHAELIVRLPKPGDEGGYLVEVASAEPGSYTLEVVKGAGLTREWWQVPTPLPASEGKYLSPFRQDGSLAEWVSKGLTAKRDTDLAQSLGKTAARVTQGARAGEAGELVGYVVGHAIAVQRAGGWESIRAGSDASFASLDDLALYLHVNYSGDPRYMQVLQQSYGIFPDLERWMAEYLYCYPFFGKACRKH